MPMGIISVMCFKYLFTKEHVLACWVDGWNTFPRICQSRQSRHLGADTGIFKGEGTVNKSYKKVGVDPQKGVGAGGGYASSRAKRGSF